MIAFLVSATGNTVWITLSASLWPPIITQPTYGVGGVDV